MIRKILAALLLLTLTLPTAQAAPDLSTLPAYELLARNVKLEGGSEPDEAQQWIIQVALNRLAWGSWGDTLYEVLSAPGQFSTWRNMGNPELATPTEKEYRNVLAVLTAEEPCLPPYVMYYRADRHHEWAGYVGYAVIGDTYFGNMVRDRTETEGGS